MTNEEKFRAIWKKLAVADYVEGCDKDRLGIQTAKELGCFYEDESSRMIDVERACPACTEALRRRDSGYGYNKCLFCPVDWGSENCECEGTLSELWYYERDPDKARDYARQISEMEWRALK